MTTNRRPVRSGWTTLVAVAAALVLTSCATPDPDATETAEPGAPPSAEPTTTAPSPTPEPSAPGTPAPGDLPADLTIELDETGNGTIRSFTLTCDPVGGDHADPEAACAALAAGGTGAFPPTPADAACTQQYGGPAVATVTGTVGSETVRASFSRTNGCEISRWDVLAPLLGSTGAL